MIFVFDANVFISMRFYYPDLFPSFWAQMDQAASNGNLVSTREVFNELEANAYPHIRDWIVLNKSIFRIPSNEETGFVSTIFSNQHFQQLISKNNLTRGLPVADPFVIACAKERKGTVVTEESLKPNAARIPNICSHFSIPYTNLQGFMKTQGWIF